jgi:hypothetical protein
LHRNKFVVSYEKRLGARQQMSTYRGTAAFMLALTGLFATALEGKAQVACYGQQEQLPAQTVAEFIANPTQLLQQFPNGGPEIISKIRDLAASNPTTLPLILNLIGAANAAQIDAIGAGLGQAALVCVRTDQAYASEIQRAVAATNNDALTLAFAAVLGDKQIGALGGGGGGGGGPTGPLFGTLGGSGGTSTNFANSGTINREPNFFTLSNVSGIGPGSTTTTTSVSPSR